MKTIPAILFVFLCACSGHPAKKSLPITGTWQLISGKLIEKGDTTVTDYTKQLSFIKVMIPISLFCSMM